MNYPNRHRNHVLESLSERYFRSIIPIEWVVNKFDIDYGTDYNCEIVSEGDVTGKNFTIQLKSKEIELDSSFILINKVKRSTINRWNIRLEPTLLIIYVKQENEAYWAWFEENTVNLTKKNKEFQIKIPRHNRFSEINWADIQKKISEIFINKTKLYDIPDSLSSSVEKEAWNLLFKKDFLNSLTKFKEIAKTGGTALIWNAISICHYELFHLDEALSSIERAINLFNGNNDLLLLNKASFLTEIGIVTSNKNKLVLSKKLFENLINNGFKTSEIYFNYGNTLNGLNMKNEAIEEFIKSINLNPNKPEVWKNLGSVFLDLRQHNKELECYDFALQINPELQEALYSKGMTNYKILGNIKYGLDLMLKSISISDKFERQFPIAYYWIGEAYIDLGQLDEALFFNEKYQYVNPETEYIFDQNARIRNALMQRNNL